LAVCESSNNYSPPVGGKDGQSEIDRQEEDKQRCNEDEVESQVGTDGEGSSEEKGAGREGIEREASSSKSGSTEANESTESSAPEAGSGEGGSFQAEQVDGTATRGRGQLDGRNQSRARSTSPAA
jgi:hypothetical protein